MGTVTGYVTGINGNLTNVRFDGSVHKNEVGYILVDGKRLKAEVIRINNGYASMQIYEMSNGIKVGDTVEFTCAHIRSIGPFHFVKAEGKVNGKLAVSGEFSFALVDPEKMKKSE